MKQIIFLTLFIISCTTNGAFAQLDSDPKRFLSGHFEYCRIETQSTVHYNGRSMTEIINTDMGEITIHSRVKWIDDQNYVLIAKKVTGPTQMPLGTKLYISIVKIEGNQMFYKYHVEDLEEKSNCLLKLEE